MDGWVRGVWTNTLPTQSKANDWKTFNPSFTFESCSLFFLANFRAQTKCFYFYTFLSVSFIHLLYSQIIYKDFDYLNTFQWHNCGGGGCGSKAKFYSLNKVNMHFIMMVWLSWKQRRTKFPKVPNMSLVFVSKVCYVQYVPHLTWPSFSLILA